MILVDTSLWIDLIDRGQPELRGMLERGQVLMHPFVIGEFALGTPRNRAQILSDMRSLPEAIPAEHGEVMHLIEHHKLYGLGIGYVDAHLLASVQLTPGALLWSSDARLQAAATKLNLAYRPAIS